MNANRLNNNKKEEQDANYWLAKIFQKDNMYDEIINIFRFRYELTPKK